MADPLGLAHQWALTLGDGLWISVGFIVLAAISYLSERLGAQYVIGTLVVAAALANLVGG